VHTPLLVGVLAATSVLAIALSVLFARAWRRQPADREYAYFALLCLSLAGYLAVLTGLNLIAIDVGLPCSRADCLRAITVPVSFAVAFLLHFALRYGGVRRSGRLMAPMYLLAAAFSWLGLTGGWWVGNIDEVVLVRGLGLELHVLRLAPSVAVWPFFVEALAVAIAVVALVLRRWRRQREPAAAALVGALVALAAIANDISLAGIGFEPVMPLMPFGLLVLGYGVAMTLVGRYGRVSSQLETSTRALHEGSQELEMSYRELKRTQDELLRSKQLAVVGELSAVIAHEVRNPLAIVNNAVASLRKRATRGEERRVLLNIINEEMGRLDHLVTHMLDYARPLVPAREEIDLRELATRSARLAEQTVEIVGEATAIGDAELLRRALDNLVQNAVQARARRITIELAVVGDVVSIAVRDDGEGMDATVLAKALSPFVSTRPTGTGLGLPVVARIAAAHGGGLSLESRTGEGTTVVLELARAGPPPVMRPRTERISVLP
jgi:signal transduction histidine kinase